MLRRLSRPLLALFVLAASPVGVLLAQDHLLNASFDVSRELFKEENTAFALQWKAKTGRDVQLQQSHVGSSQQARSVRDGLPADVVTLNQISDIQLLVSEHLVAPDWATKFPNHAAPYTSTTTFVVVAGNPKGIHDWNDLIRPGIRIALVNPKTGGNGRYAFLAAWAYGLKHFQGDEEKTRAFVAQVYQHVPVLDSGGRAATSTFANRGLADVLITFASEVPLLVRDVDGKKFEQVVPSTSLRVEFPVAVVDGVVDRSHNRVLAEAYLNFLYSEEGQRIIAHNGFIPLKAAEGTDRAVLDVRTVFGSWTEAQAKFFADGAIFDQIVEANGKG